MIARAAVLPLLGLAVVLTVIIPVAVHPRQ